MNETEEGTKRKRMKGTKKALQYGKKSFFLRTYQTFVFNDLVSRIKSKVCIESFMCVRKIHIKVKFSKVFAKSG